MHRGVAVGVGLADTGEEVVAALDELLECGRGRIHEIGDERRAVAVDDGEDGNVGLGTAQMSEPHASTLPGASATPPERASRLWA